MNSRAIQLLLVFVLLALPASVTAQQSGGLYEEVRKGDVNPQSKGATESDMGLYPVVSKADVTPQSQPGPFRPNPNLSDQEKRGQHWFLQRCALCHLGRYSKSSADLKPLPISWRLQGVFKGASPEKEKALREYILKGSQKMPGYQYTLAPNEIDDLIAYLKTL